MVDREDRGVREKSRFLVRDERVDHDAKVDIAGTDGSRKERALAAEIAMRERTGVSSGGSV